MKKTLVFSLMLAAVSASWAQPQPVDGQIYYTPAGELSRGVQYLQPDDDNKPAPVGKEVSVAVRIPAEAVSLYANSLIKTFTLVSGAGPANYDKKDFDPLTSRNYTMFLATSLTEAPFYTQDITVGPDCYTLNEFELTTPQKIDGSKPLYVGVTYPILSTSDYYISMDAGQNAPVYVAVSDKGGARNFVAGPQTYGYPCFGMMLSGDALPQHAVKIVSVDAPRSVDTESTFNVPVRIMSTGASKVETVTFDYTVNGIAGSADVRVLDPETRRPVALLNGQEGIADLTGLKCTLASPNSSALLRISKVDGSTNVTASQAAKYMNFTSYPYSTAYKRVPVIEEATSTGCQWCPAGAALTDYLHETYGNDFISLAYHVHFSSTRDQMKNEWSQAFADEYARTYPYGIYNRRDVSRLGYEGKLANLAAAADAIYENCRDNFSYANLDFEAKLDKEDAPENVSLKARVKFAFDVPRQTGDAYQLSFVIAEDNVGPYKQINAYAGGSGTYDMGGWELKGGRVDTMFDHVVRRVEGFPGIAGSIPTGLSAGQEVEYSVSMPLENVKRNRFSVVALLTQVNSGEIVNARKIDYVLPVNINFILQKNSHAGVYALDNDELTLLETLGEGENKLTLAGDKELFIIPEKGHEFVKVLNSSDREVDLDKDEKIAPTGFVTIYRNYSDVYTIETRPEAGIESIESAADASSAVYYDLQGRRVNNPAAGIYIKVCGTEVSKVVVR